MEKLTTLTTTLVETKSKRDAVELATRCMEPHRVHASGFVGEREVRPLEDMGW